MGCGSIRILKGALWIEAVSQLFILSSKFTPFGTQCQNSFFFLLGF
jgi:hypothetical protein